MAPTAITSPLLNCSGPLLSAEADSQDDSQAGRQVPPKADEYGLSRQKIELKRTLMDSCGCRARGLQNRLRASKTQGPVGHTYSSEAGYPPEVEPSIG